MWRVETVHPTGIPFQLVYLASVLAFLGLSGESSPAVFVGPCSYWGFAGLLLTEQRRRDGLSLRRT